MEAGRKSGDWAVWNEEREKKERKVSVRKVVLFRYKDAKFKVATKSNMLHGQCPGSGVGQSPLECWKHMGSGGHCRLQSSLAGKQRSKEVGTSEGEPGVKERLP